MTPIKNAEQVYKFKFKSKNDFWIEHSEGNETRIVFTAFYDTFKINNKLSNFTVTGMNVDNYFQVVIKDCFHNKSLYIKFKTIDEYIAYGNSINRSNKIDNLLN
ncbi:hypothetical protein D0N36_07760 [Hymenobacter lapidiphilus]|nr:hypothetical protein D0N36_07760 [Hymenobacter sp. CCM 8763]